VRPTTPIIFFDPSIGTGGAGFTAVVSDLVPAGTRHAQNWGGAATVLGTLPSGNGYSGAIARTHLVNAIADANAQIKSANRGTCLGMRNRVKCYSTDPDKYALFGVEDGLEFLGSGTSHLGVYSKPAARVHGLLTAGASADRDPAIAVATLPRRRGVRL
jgi:hypothetical protein